MIELKYDKANEKNCYIKAKLINRFGKVQWVKYDAYLIGLIGAIKRKKENERHSLVIIIGGVGDGKTTLCEGLAGLDAAYNGHQLELEDVAWSMNSFITKMDSTENHGRPILGDEFIQAGGNRAMAITNIGNKLKIGFVTKRLKRNTYFLLADELEEFAEKLIKMADCIIVAKTIYDERGYFDCYTDKTNMLFLYRAFKDFKKNWHSPEVKRIKPDRKGKFFNYKGIFLDSEEFDKRKMEETKQMEEDSAKGVSLSPQMIEAMKLKRTNPKMTYAEIGKRVNVHYKTIGDWFKKMKLYEIME